MTLVHVTGGRPRSRRSSLAVLAAALVLATAACGEDDLVQAPDANGADQTEQTPAPTADAAPTPTPTGDGEDAAEQTAEPADGDGTEQEQTFVAVDIDFSEAPDTVPPGAHVLRLVNEGLLFHDVTVEELGDRTVVGASGGETAEGRVELEPGTYTYYCSVPGHRLAGMEGTLEVAEGG